MSKYIATSLALSKNKSLQTILGAKAAYYTGINDSSTATYLGWGRKKSGDLAIKSAKKNGANHLLLEDGFLRSANRQDQSHSMVFDNKGIYYDATCASQLEALIQQPLSPEEAIRAQKIQALWCEFRLSKYNSAPEYTKNLPDDYVLVIDQVFGDMSISYGLADRSSFENMLQAALLENPNSTIIVKTHPDILTRTKQGHFDIAKISKNPRVKIIATNCHPVKLIENAKTVYCVTSQVGFEALLWGKKLRCFGMPFYAGWGLTHDELPAPNRRKPIEFNQIIHAALVKYPSYIDPKTHSKSQFEAVAQQISMHRRQSLQFPKTLYAIKFSIWKQSFLPHFLKGSDVIFVKNAAAIPKKCSVIIWGSQQYPNLDASCQIIRVEDGFLRSTGLGADLHKPISLVFDSQGIYYDSTKPSKIENILQNTVFSDADRSRAKALQAQIVAAGLSKYNLTGENWQRPQTDKTVILVPGQVENDVSIKFGSPHIKTNIDLLKAVKQANPDAYIVYKPHPDVVAGLRNTGQGENNAAQYCHEVIRNVDSVTMLKQVDEVHTMTSLIGFEALLRDVKVICYGQPFYSGWGLTQDIHPNTRRLKTLKVEELVSGVLIEYTRYVSRMNQEFITPEQAVEELIQQQEKSRKGIPWWRNGLRFILKLWVKFGFRSNA